MAHIEQEAKLIILYLDSIVLKILAKKCEKYLMEAEGSIECFEDDLNSKKISIDVYKKVLDTLDDISPFTREFFNDFYLDKIKSNYYNFFKDTRQKLYGT